ncbi:MAG: MarR family transcriptional regulator [Chloroflexota bacterium]|nr:MarR family transcriptional regulator [Chloroflexota bacterium]MDQ6908483.1 MarR family transcriptional regulator [Chloroflexota bacterium]
MAARSTTKSQEIVQSLRSVITRVTGDASGAWMDLDVTMPQMKVLMLLRENGALRVGVLARHLNVSTPTITGIVDRLVRQDLVKREDDPSDRRVVLNVLTPKGEQLMERLRHRSDEELTRIIGGLNAQEQADLARALKRLEEVIGGSASVAAD